MEKIKLHINDGIAVMEMDDCKANAMNSVFFKEFNEAFDQVENKAKLLIIMGRKSFFSGGLDLKYMSALQPKELNDFTETFAKTLLRVNLFPITTIAACTGHAIAGGAMLTFACDLRYIVDGQYRFNVNETKIGIVLPSWMLMLGSNAIPITWRAESLLHAKVYTPKETFEKGITHALIQEDADIISSIVETTKDIQNLNLLAYADSKKRLREKEVNEVLKLLKDELPCKEN